MYDLDPRGLKLAALRDVLKQPVDYQIRSVMRWYSRTFHTPLHLVESSVPLEELLQAYYEEYFENMDEGEREAELYELTKTAEEAAAEKSNEDTFLKFAQEQALKSAHALPVKEEAPAELPPTEEVSVNFVKGNLLEEYGDFDPFAPKKK